MKKILAGKPPVPQILWTAAQRKEQAMPIVRKHTSRGWQPWQKEPDENRAEHEKIEGSPSQNDYSQEEEAARQMWGDDHGEL